MRSQRRPFPVHNTPWQGLRVAALAVILAIVCSSCASSTSQASGQSSTPAAHPSSLGPSAFAVFTGAWSGHGGGIDIQANGRFLIAMRTYQWCGQAPPPCDSMSGNEIIDGDQATGQLTSISGEVAKGAITHTTDQADTPKGNITITLNPSTNSVNVNNISFCGTSAPVGYCGA